MLINIVILLIVWIVGLLLSVLRSVLLVLQVWKLLRIRKLGELEVRIIIGVLMKIIILNWLILRYIMLRNIVRVVQHLLLQIQRHHMLLMTNHLLVLPKRQIWVGSG